jgi:hypothetical protein
VRFFQHENKTLLAINAFQAVVLVFFLPVPHGRLPFQRREVAKNIPASVKNERQCARATVASPVKVCRGETIAASAPQKRKPFRAELAEERRKGRDDLRVKESRLDLQGRNSEPQLLNLCRKLPLRRLGGRAGLRQSRPDFGRHARKVSFHLTKLRSGLSKRQQFRFQRSKPPLLSLNPLVQS